MSRQQVAVAGVGTKISGPLAAEVMGISWSAALGRPFHNLPLGAS